MASNKSSRTAFKPVLEQYGSRTKLFLRLSDIITLILLCLPFTNWAIPILRKMITGKVTFYLY